MKETIKMVMNSGYESEKDHKEGDNGILRITMRDP